MHCNLLISSLFPPGARTPENDPLHRVTAPALQTLIASSTRTSSMASEPEEWLCQVFEVARQQDYPYAPFSLLADGVQPQGRYWLRADPVHLAVERDQLILTESSTFTLSQAESNQLVSTMSQHFSADGLYFCAPHPQRWYLGMDKTPTIATRNINQVAGHNIHAHMPHGHDELRWRALLNEGQMLLFEHPVNVEREKRGETPINSVWFWGGGTLPTVTKPAFDQVWANDALASGLALANKVCKQALPADAEQWLAQAGAGNHLLVLDNLRPAACYGTPHAWRERLEHLERQWFAPLERAVRKGVIELTLHAPTSSGTLSFGVSRGSLWKFWRRRKPLIHYRPKNSEA